jgi:hypothetical protein
MSEQSIFCCIYGAKIAPLKLFLAMAKTPAFPCLPKMPVDALYMPAIALKIFLRCGGGGAESFFYVVLLGQYFFNMPKIRSTCGRVVSSNC